MAFSATDAAFEGFRVVRRNPMTLVFWSLFYGAIMAAAFAITGPSLISFIAATERLEASGATPALEDFAPMFQTLGLIFVVLLPLSLVASAMMYAAVARSVLEPTRSAFGYLRLGADEMRVLVVSILLTIVLMAVIMASWALIIGAGAVAIGQNAPIMWVVTALLFLATTALFVWLAVRLSLAIPITLAERRIAVFDSFRMTKGRFWPLLGMAIIAVLLSIVVSFLGSLVFMPFQMMAGGGLESMAASADGLDPMQIVTEFWPIILAYVVINAIISALQVAVLYAPFSAAYRGIIGLKPSADVFS